MLKSIFIVLFMVSSVFGIAEEEIPNAWTDKSFVIISSNKNYSDALKFAQEASVKLKVNLDLRGLSPNPQTGLSYSVEICEKEWESFPCYLARGRGDDGEYISIEYSNQYKGFQKGYYIVVYDNGSIGSPRIKKSLKKVKVFYKDAYIKNTKVWLGCIS